MTVVKQSRVVPYNCEQMFNLVNLVEEYDQFVPYCTKSIVHTRNEDEVQATLVIAAAGVSKSFTTHNHLQTNKMIEIRLVNGPFKHLEGFWRFDQVLEGCQISLDLEFELANKIVAMLLGSIFEQIAEKMVEAFCTRAKVVYGSD